jgi:hypothetical protein
MSVKSDLYSKVSCCFADEVYNQYLHERYGVSSCITYNSDRMHELNRLKNLFKFKTALQPEAYLDNFNTYKSTSTDVCNIASIIEKINSL